MSNPIRKLWKFRSSSNPQKLYETLQYENGSTSCNCPGWTKRCVDGVRTCTHTRSVHAGTADQECVTSLDNPSGITAPTQPVRTTQRALPAADGIVFPKKANQPGRKILWLQDGKKKEKEVA
jgi:hypothetical protein